jgi:hypothetical protein
MLIVDEIWVIHLQKVDTLLMIGRVREVIQKNQKNFSIEPISTNPRIVLCSVVYRRCIEQTLV